LLFTASIKKFFFIMCRIFPHRVGLLLFILISQNSIADSADLQDDPQQASQPLKPGTYLCRDIDTSAAKHVKPRAFPLDEQDNTEISADFTTSTSDGSSSLDGNVIIERHLIRIKADHANYSKSDDELKFSGNVHIDTESMSLDAEGGTVSINKEGAADRTSGEFNNIEFYIPDSNMKGKAEVIHAGDNANAEEGKTNHSVLNNASITSCDLFDPDWLISADEIQLDHDDEYGSADDVVIRFKDIPFMYVPYMEFPTSDKRRSGLLFPAIGTSSSRGLELAVPWYWNIAPNQDAVLTPRYMEKRGFEMGADYRYLTRSTIGELKGVYLPNDLITQEERYTYQYQQHSQILSNLSFDADIQDISDSEYFNDFSNNLNTTSQTYLDRNASLRYDLNNWHLKAMIQDIQTIDESTPVSTRPYERFPQITFLGDTELVDGPLLFTLDSEYVDFIHEDTSKTTGTRIIIRPGLRLPLSGAAWFIDPAIKFSHTQYDVGTVAGTSQTVDNRNLPMSSVDAGLYFERYLDNGYQQTLEPRLFYLNVPYVDQSNIPLFDTSIPNFSVTQLFRDNRFVGSDRIGDTNQLTFALTSRILDPGTGSEFIRASIGQIYYFEDRNVTLLGGPPETSTQSDIIAELDVNWGPWQGNIDMQWDPSNNRFTHDNYFLHYKTDAKHLFNIGYRRRLIYNSDVIDIEQTDTSFVYAFNRNYSGIARWNYSLKDNKDIDTIIGLGYDSCCWAIQVFGQRLIRNSTTNDDAYDTAILVQFVFKGLGSLSGSRAQNTLEQSIHGYTDIFQ
jgi:LPS-assembly protein